jgi:hypothetical protein
MQQENGESIMMRGTNGDLIIRSTRFPVESATITFKELSKTLRETTQFFRRFSDNPLPFLSERQQLNYLQDIIPCTRSVPGSNKTRRLRKKRIKFLKAWLRACKDGRSQ